MKALKIAKNKQLKNRKMKEKIEKLKNSINYHNHRYYNLDSPEISDAEYDTLINELLLIEKENPHLKDKDSPTQKVGGTVYKKFETTKHSIPMLSIDNVFNDSEFLEFDARIKKFLQTTDKDIVYTAEPKMDGIAVEIVYKNGKLAKASTRG